MQYDIKLVKLVSGETVMGNYKSEKKTLDDVVLIQTVPTGGGVQIAILPYGFPYEQEISASLDEKHIMYEYQKVPEEMKTKYLEAKSDIKIASTSSLNDGGIIL